MFDPFALPFFQRGIVEILLLASVSGLLGVWIVLRGLAFYAHAVGTAAVPGLVLADGLGFSAIFGAFGAALVMAALIALLLRRRSVGGDSATAIVLAGALALGVILASDVFGSQGSVDRLLFGSLLAIGTPELVLAAVAALAAAAATAILGPRWLAAGFTDRNGNSDSLLIALIALAAVAALAAVGALLATAILVVPAATTRLIIKRLPAWQLTTAALAAAEGVIGMILAYQLNVPPGAAIAVLAGIVFALVAVAVLIHQRRPRLAPLALTLLGLSALAVAGCGSDDGGEASSSKITVAATTTQVGDLVREVGGDAVTVKQILTPNSEAHDYEPRPNDVGAVAASKIVFASGLGLDAWSTKLVKESGSEAEVVDLSSGLPVSHATGEGEAHADEKEGEEHGETDPHWWHDLTNLEAATTEVETALIAADPAAKDQITANADAYRAKIKKVDEQIRACLNKVPANERLIVTDHDAFVYFTERYGVTSKGAVFPSTSTQGQASAGEVAALEKLIREEKVKAIFPESSLNPALAERIASDTGASSDYTLYGDTLGAADSPEGTVLGAEAANAKAMVAGMTGGKERCTIES
ncbi:MAG: zinc ABC transporter substrate-binding protein [Solirubrobacteraceae bacterium]|nr:zinc ABC transporter substrate-binding protein [Solirubrobacteraceae bacterium]MDP5034472.1 zinc ABC transporter substrate-binding protein [Solirubrobacteraceae bacterium]